MKRVLYLILILGLLLQPGTVSGIVQSSSADDTLAQPGWTRPGYADPPQPIPYNKTGYPSKMGIDTRVALARTYQPWAASVAGLDSTQAVEAMGYNDSYDPFMGNYSQLNWDNLALITLKPDHTGQRVRVYKQPEEGSGNLTPPVDTITAGSDIGYTRTGDLNRDGIDEIVTGTGGNHLQIGNVSSKRYIQDVPAAASPDEGQLWQFVRGYDDQLWVLYEGAENWKPLGGTLLSSPAAVSVEVGQVDVLMLSGDAHIWRCPVTATTDQCAWEDWGGAPEGYGEFTGHPALVANSATSYDVFVRSSANSLWHLAYRNGLGDWEDLGGYIISSPAAASRDGRIDVVATRYDRSLWHMSRPSDAAAWSAWVSLGRVSLYSPAIVSPAAGMLDVFVTGEDQAVYRNHFQDNGWGGWLPFAGTETHYGPAAALIRGAQGSVAVLFHTKEGTVFAQKRDTPAVDSWVLLDADGVMPLLPMWGRLFPVPNNSPQWWGFELGHFLPNGRMQGIAYAWDSSRPIKLKLIPFEFLGGFEPVLLGSGFEIDLTRVWVNPKWIHAKVGDYDGDGLEEMAMLAADQYCEELNVIKIDETGALARPPASLWLGGLDPGWGGAGALLSGNFYLGTTVKDELAIVYNGLHVYELGADWQLTERFGGLLNPSFTPLKWAITSGDIIPELEPDEKLDEIVLSGVDKADNVPCPMPLCWVDEYWLKTRVYSLINGQVTKMQMYPEHNLFGVWSDTPTFEFNVEITTGDLRRNGTAGVGIAASRMPAGGYEAKWFFTTLEYDGATRGMARTNYIVSQYPENKLNASCKLVSGNLLGEGRRLMKPTFRSFQNIVSPVAWINAPPQLYDTNYINPSPAPGEDPHIVNPGSFAKITLTSTADEAINVEAKSRWSVDASLGHQWGDEKAAYFKVSLEASVGQDFSRVSGSSFSQKYDISITSKVDRVLYSLTDFYFFEYPILSGDTSTVEPGWDILQGGVFMTATMPKVQGLNTIRIKELATSTCGLVFNPGHENRNLLSYASVADEMPGYDPAYALTGGTEFTADTSEKTISLTLVETESKKLTKSVNFSASAKVEGALRTGPGEGPFPKLSASIKASYASGTTAGEEIRTGQGVKVDGALMPIRNMAGDPIDKYTHYVTPYFYYDDKTLVLNYVTRPGTSSWWTTGPGAHGWTKPDLAFVRPWNQLSCYDGQGQLMWDFSPEITFDDYVRSPGEKVTVTATVHNYSTSPVTNVPVKFYSGDPANGSSEIVCDTPQGNIDNLGARKKVEVSCTFTVVQGVGEQRIYVVADPGSLFDEHFEDNNQAFGLLTVAEPTNNSGADPGLNSEKEGMWLPLASGGTLLAPAVDLPVKFFLPYAALKDGSLASLELAPSSVADHAFSLTNFGLKTENIAYASFSKTFGLDQDLNRDYSIPTAWVRVGYADADVRPWFFEEASLRLYYLDSTGKWIDNQSLCGGEIIRDPVNNVVESPICRTGTYVLGSLPPPINVYIPVVRK